MHTSYRLAFLFSLLVTLASAQAPALKNLARMPQSFEPNRGQAEPSVDFVSHGPGYTLSLIANSANLQLVAPAAAGQTAALRVRLVGSDPGARSRGVDRQAGTSNYFLGNVSKLWLTDIPQYGRVEYQGVYPGIDLAYYGNNERLEYDFILGPHADPGRIRLAVEGADRVSIDSAGDLVLTVGSAEIRERKPVVYQESRNGRRVVEGRYVAREGNQVGFELGSYDPDKPVVIDPVLVFSTFFGGTGSDQGIGVAVDSTGSTYLCGGIAGTLPGTTIGTPGTSTSTTAAYFVKISPSGAHISSTFIGGASDQAVATGIALDVNGNVYLAGNTSSASFPTVNAIQKNYGGSNDVFVLELNNAGNTLIYSTYLGGSAWDAAGGITVDSSGNALVSGSTVSRNFPVLNATQSTLAGTENAFAAKIAPGGSSLIYSTYFGGTGSDFDGGAAVDKFGDLIFFGETLSPNFPVLNALQPNFCGWSPGRSVSTGHGWVAMLSPAGVPIFSTFICGSAAEDSVRGAVADAAGNVIITGATASSTFPVLNAIQSRFGGGSTDAFLAKLNPAGTLVFSTYLGGSGNDVGRGVTLDQLGNFYVTGSTSSSNFPTVSATQTTLGGADDAFLTKINAAESAIVFSTYIGGSGEDYGYGLTVDGFANAYVAGSTASANFPTASPLQPAYGGGSDDAFIAMISTCGFTFSSSTPFGIAGGGGTVSITTTPECGWSATSNSVWITITSSPTTGAGPGSVSYSVAANSGAMRQGSLTIGGQTVSITQYGMPSLSVTETNAASFTQGQTGATYTVVAGNGSGAGPTTGTVTLTQTLPSGLTLVSMTGTGWSCTAAVCSRSDVLAPGTNYPAVTVAVNVAANAGSPLAAQVTVSGGGSSGPVTATDNTTIATAGAAALSLTETNVASFTQGQTGATYAVVVGNGSGAGPTTGTVTLTQTLPSGLTLVSMTGTGWSCTAAVCSRSDVLAPGTNYPAVTVTVNVAANAGSPLAAQVTVSGGGAPTPVTATDSTTIIPLPVLGVAETNTASFTQGQTGAVYTVTVSNSAAAGPTKGTATLTQNLPAGLTLASMAGTGWSCSGASCTRSDVLAPGASYPPVTVTVNVAANAGSPLAAQVTVSGGGALSPGTATDNTTINSAVVSVLSVTETAATTFAQGQNGAAYTVAVANSATAAATTGTVTLTQTLPSGLSLVSMAGTGWACTGVVCTRSDVLAPGTKYPAVTVTVNVAANAGTPLTAQVTVSGGGSAPAAATDVTAIQSATITMTLTNLGPLSLIYGGLEFLGQSGTETNNCPTPFPANSSCNFTMTLSGASGLIVVPDWANFGQFMAADQQLIAGPPDPTRLVFMGDSTTFFWDQPSPYGAGSLSAVRPFVNRGIPAQTTEQMLVRFREDVVKLSPAAVHIWGGTNDVGTNTGPETNAEILDQIQSMTEVAKANGIKVLIASVTPVIDTPQNEWTLRRPNATIVALNELIQAYCLQSGATYVDYYSVLVDSNGEMNINLTVDGLHPNTAGYAAMVPVARAALTKTLGY